VGFGRVSVTTSPVGAPAPVPAAAVAGRPSKAMALWLLPLVAGIVLWAVSLASISVDHLGQYGLLPELPVTWFAGLAVLTGGAVWATLTTKANGWIIAAYVAAVVVVLYATVAAVSDVPQYAWTYKHVGVAHFFESEGRVNLNVDIYNRWPAFFALAAAFSKLSGVSDPIHYVAWSEVFFALLDAFLVGLIARAFVPDARVAGFAALVFSLVNWVGATYFSPQASAFVLALGVMLIVLRSSAGYAGSYKRLAPLVTRITRRPATDGDTVAASLFWHRGPAIGVVLFLDAVITATHQLTPYVVVLQVAALAFFGVVRPRWLPLALAAITILYLAPNFAWTERNYGLLSGLNPAHNAERQTTLNGLDPVAGKALNAHISQLLTVAMFGLGIVSAIRLAFVGRVRQALTLCTIAFAPFVVLLGQSYGGEAVLRVILFGSPWCAMLVAFAVATLKPRPRVVASFAVAAAMAAGFVGAYFGASELNIVTPGEVAASEYYYAHAPGGSVLLNAATGFPSRSGARYPIMRGPEGDSTPNVIQNQEFRHRPLGAADIPAVIQVMHHYADRGFMVFSSSQDRYTDTYRLAPPNALASLETAIAHSPRFRLWYRNGDARIYRLIG
jgi:hypothetical protein